MKTVKLGRSELDVPAVIVGCMRLSGLDTSTMNTYLHRALELGANFFDHADIYGKGQSESIFGEALKGDASLKRESIMIQSKCGIREGFYDFSEAHILEAVDGSLKRLQTDYLDVLLLHRPDALVEPEAVASAFDKLQSSGKVRYFGVSNHKPMQIELLKKYVKQDLLANQLQFSLPVSNMVSNGLEVNMGTEGSIDRDGSILDYCRLENMTIQAWSPFQMPDWKGVFIGSSAYKKLNQTLTEIGEKYGVSETVIAAAWILRHPAGMQLVAGTSKIERFEEVAKASDIELTREEWYRLYRDAGHRLP